MIILNIFVFMKALRFLDYLFFFTIMFLLILVASLIYFVRLSIPTQTVSKENNSKEDDLALISEMIKSDSNRPVRYTSYEKEQEEKAIISYDELINSANNVKLNYVEGESNDESGVKMFDLNNLVSNIKDENVPKLEVHVISLQKEEEFLKALKELRSSLN